MLVSRYGVVKKYATESREEGDYDAQLKNLDRLVTNLQNKILYKLDEGLKPLASTTRTRISSKRKKELEPEPEPVYYAPRPFPLGSQFHYPSMMVLALEVGPHDLGFMGTPQRVVSPPGARYDPIGSGFEFRLFGR
ncbi:unnamed protein product [Eruca vesicaria subsp. sativa]|uniref:Uncharacterized protein n=1 Tax=Eruca vesicaria subsp. sativa TaxID=29727 RepID=A0ABC8J2K8_ERUVS|nr:unnamed protein product [Eruca vesicaria subsp. sativa]